MPAKKTATHKDIETLRIKIETLLPQEASVTRVHNEVEITYKFTIPRHKEQETAEVYKDRIEGLGNKLAALLEDKSGSSHFSVMAVASLYSIRVTHAKEFSVAAAALEEAYLQAPQIAPEAVHTVI